MSIPKIILIGSVSIFALIAGFAGIKKFTTPKSAVAVAQQQAPTPTKKPVAEKTQAQVQKKAPVSPTMPAIAKDDFPDVDRVYQLFTTGPSKLPIVETIVYSSSVPWLKGRPAWVADYAVHYQTSRHFIARSLNGKPDYFSQKVGVGSKFNVFKKDKKIQFYLLIDTSRCKMGLYYFDVDANERVLIKTYKVGLGRQDSKAPSGCLTPIGKYALGNKIAVYQPGTTGFFQDQKVEMIRIFGTRWIPFGEEIGPCSAAAKGYGIQGAPWEINSEGQLVEKRSCIGAFDSDGGIRLASEDLEELFSIIITKPAVVEIVKDFHEAKPPGVEVATPAR